MLQLTSAFLLMCAVIACAQQPPKPSPAQPPPMRVNVLNVCAPTDAEQKEIAAALARIPQRASFTRDYEVTRGHTTDEGGNGSDWVRVRREFPKAMPLLAVQFSYIADAKESQETAVFYARESKSNGVMQVAIEDRVSAGVSAANVLAADTPVDHIRVERYGKSSLVLARCPNDDQTAYEPLFRTASQIMAAYRARLDVKRLVPAELGRLSTGNGGRRPINVKPMGSQRAPESK
ncbi:MAG: hypothetical protein LAN64_10565 [Acidobacteriia bacterium]|nr:hypothetical protein [Terriglobia bacterium]